MADVLDAALRLLSYRPRSEAEVRRRLSRRFPPSQVEDAVVTLRERGLLDDAAFARFWRQSRERHRPRGAAAMRWELLRMGVSREVVEEALVGMDEHQDAYRAAVKIVPKLSQADYATFRKKMVGHLRRRGFASEAVRTAIQRSWQELSDPINCDVECNTYEQETDEVGHDGH